VLTQKEIKQRYFKKIYENANTIKCKCGCGISIRDKDKYGRSKSYISGHNTIRKYNDPKQYQREWFKRNKDIINLKRRTIYQRNGKRKQRKIELIKLKGSVCVECDLEYDKTNGAVFQFHHKDSRTKEFTITSWLERTWTKEFYYELDKTVLVCSNCHDIIHHDVF